MGLICKLKKFVFGCEKENIIKVKRFVNGVLLPKMGSAAAAGMDFYQPESVVVEPHQTQYVTLGLAMEIPKRVYVDAGATI